LEVGGESRVDAKVVTIKRARERRYMMAMIVYSSSNWDVHIGRCTVLVL
jgi:hypothetical protein